MSNQQERIKDLLRKEKAILLAHYYQDAEIKEVANFIGDSLELAKKARNSDAETIVFSGVNFMAETAKVLNPNKRVLLPDINASCSLAESCEAGSFEKFIKSFDKPIVVSYINSSIEVKCLSDIICTSSNAERIIESIPRDRQIIFAPDKNLGKYLSQKTGRNMILWDGACIVHEAFEIDKILKICSENPGAKIISHPESEMALLDVSSFIGSTSALLNFVIEDSAETFIVATEVGILDEMRKKVPNKKLIPAPIFENNECSCSECAFMKLNTLEKIERCLVNGYPEVKIDEAVRLKAVVSLERMMKMS